MGLMTEQEALDRDKDKPLPRTPMSMRLFGMLYECQAYFERDGRNWIHIFEPLDVDIPPDARPYCSSWDITFYDHTGNNVLARNIKYHGGDHLNVAVILSDGVWYERSSGRCIYRNGRWWMRWSAARNTDLARVANWGWPAFRNPDITIPWSRRLRWRFETKAHNWNARRKDAVYYLKQRVQNLRAGRRWRIYFDRFPNELMLLPRLYLSWPDQSQHSYNFEIGWLQWSVQVCLIPGHIEEMKWL